MTIKNPAIILLFSLLLVSCTGLDYIDSLFPVEEVSLGNIYTPTPNQLNEAEILPEPTIAPVNGNNLVIWLPPIFDPYSGNASGDKIQAQIELFQEKNPQVSIDIRVKAENGAGSLLNSLLAASSIAPGALPSVVLFSRSDLESAAKEGILLPIDAHSSVIDESDWFPFANKMGIYHGETFGLPFAADAVVLITHNEFLSMDYIPLEKADRY
ncbi:MAG: hypothetical protein J7L66_03495, partial [Anaerolineaceae bacterium]|nr:hypothetical protein [Anaerolineaceae bacterium]